MRLANFMPGILLMAWTTIGSVPLAAQKKPRADQASVAGTPSTPRPDIDRFRARMNTILGEPRSLKTSWGILIVDRDTGQALYELNADRHFVPGSNAKVVTTAFALAELGSDYRFRTTVESNGTFDPDGRLAGDLILVGRGDPDLSNRKFPYAQKAERDGAEDRILAELADAVVARGLKEVDGNIVGDDSYFPYDPYPAEWTNGDLFFTFGAPVSAIAFNDNTFSLDVQAGANVGDRAIVTVMPTAAAGTFGQEILTIAPGLQPDLSVVRQPGTNFILVRGSMPVGHAALRLDLAMTEPAEIAARTLSQELEARGVRITGTISVRHAPPPFRSAKGFPLPTEVNAAVGTEARPLVLAEHLSPPLIESILLTNKISQNLHAELLLRTVAREKAGVGSSDSGLQLEQAFLKSVGIPEGDIFLSDGSGLARDDLVKPRAIVQLLRYAAQQPWGAAFLSTLPVAGVDGTLQGRMTKPTVAGLIQAKTGSLDHVHALSGYATTLRGEYLAFSIFGNNDPEHGGDANSVIDEIGAAMVEMLGPPVRPRTNP
jgi:D-alanyl-D-alanine carboxypeptidase/D-alanyl-D-alanine-endopeptidase (penicillin-binding protein 4)